jgi:hypothetical protein
MNTPLRGGCACGAVRYECAAEPMMSVICHCRDCQRSTGAGHAAEMVVPTATFAFVKGEPRWHRVTGNSGNLVSRGFCGECGSPLVASSSGHPEALALQAGSLDEPARFRPAHHVFVSSAQPWDRIDPKTTAFAGIPDFQQILARLVEREATTRTAAIRVIQEMFESETRVSDESAAALLAVLCANGLVVT